MGQAAYDYNSAARRAQAPQTRQPAPLRVERGGKRRLSPFQAAMRHFVQLAALALLVTLSGCLLWSEAQLVELNDQIQDARAALTSEQSQYTYYTTTLNSKTSMTSIEEAASRLGLMKIDPSQITYVRLNSTSVLVRRESAVRKWTDLLHDGAVTVAGALQRAQ